MSDHDGEEQVITMAWRTQWGNTTRLPHGNASALLRGQLSMLSVDRLVRMLTMLGQDVQIVVRVPHPSRKGGSIRVVEHA